MQVAGGWEGMDGLASLTEVLICVLAPPLTLAPHLISCWPGRVPLSDGEEFQLERDKVRSEVL